MICFYILMHECTSIIINFFNLFQQALFNKRFVVEGEGARGFLTANKNEQGERIFMLTLERNCLIFQTANRVPSNKLLGSC